MKIDKKLIEDAVKALEFVSINKMQEEMLKNGLTAEPLLLNAPTGTGKTFGYLLILLHFLHSGRNIQGLILVPSRELVLQIEQVFRKMNTGYKVNSFYGGHSIRTEMNNLKQPPAVAVGTPGRIADLLRREYLDTREMKILILDEFDKSLELGFEEEMRYILEKLKTVRKKILISATKMKEIPEFTGIRNPVMMNFLEKDVQPNLSYKIVVAQGEDKLAALKKLIIHLSGEATLIFCNHREAVERISLLLKCQNIAHDIFHGGMEQQEREKSLIKFRSGSLHFLISTDLASRGLDIPELQNIVHYQLPFNEAAFIHRNGRTARMRAEGTVWMIFSDSETKPEFLTNECEKIDLSELKISNNAPLWETLYFGGGKKEKIHKTDIVGLLIQLGGLVKDDIGLISIQDHSAFAAVKRDKIRKSLQRLRGCKIKGMKVKIAISE